MSVPQACPAQHPTQPLSCEAGPSWHRGLTSASSLIGAKQRAVLAALWAALRLLTQPPDGWPATLHGWGHVPNFSKGAHSGHVFWLLFMRFVLAHESQSNYAGKNLEDHLVYHLHYHHSVHTFLVGKQRLTWYLSIIIKFNIVKYFNTKKLLYNRCLFCINHMPKSLQTLSWLILRALHCANPGPPLVSQSTHYFARMFIGLLVPPCIPPSPWRLYQT